MATTIINYSDYPTKAAAHRAWILSATGYEVSGARANAALSAYVDAHGMDDADAATSFIAAALAEHDAKLANEAAAAKARTKRYFARQRTCTHNWRIVSHEEAECRNCGFVRFIPDL